MTARPSRAETQPARQERTGARCRAWSKSFAFALATAMLAAGCAQILDTSAFSKRGEADAGEDLASVSDASLSDAEPSADAHGSESARLAECGGFPYRGDACGACVAAHCCAEAHACASDPACSERVECEALCAVDDAACRDTCNVSVVPFDRALLDVKRCQTTLCQESCQIPCGVAGPPFDVSCMRAQPGFCQAEEQLWQVPEGPNRIDCMRRCEWGAFTPEPDPCGCAAAHPVPAELIDSYRAAALSCYLNQAPAGDFRCAGQVRWPTVKTESYTIDLNLSFRDYFNSAGVPQLRVTQCATGDLTCSAPLGLPAVTDARGRTTITARRRAQNTNLYFGYLLTEGGGYPAALHYFFPPEQQSGWIGRSMAMPANLPPFDDAHGLVVAQLMDCSMRAGVGLRVSTDRPEAVISYTYDGQSDYRATQTGPQGLFGIENLSPGFVAITTVLAATGQRVGSMRVVVRAGAATILVARPTPLDD